MTAKLVSAKELAARYSVAPKTVRKWARCKLLPVVKFNCRCIRFDVEKCDEVVYRRTRIAA
jgi:predicted site-specific integrase-resolvase